MSEKGRKSAGKAKSVRTPANIASLAGLPSFRKGPGKSSKRKLAQPRRTLSDEFSEDAEPEHVEVEHADLPNSGSDSESNPSVDIPEGSHEDNQSACLTGHSPALTGAVIDTAAVSAADTLVRGMADASADPKLPPTLVKERPWEGAHKGPVSGTGKRRSLRKYLQSLSGDVVLDANRRPMIPRHFGISVSGPQGQVVRFTLNMPKTSTVAAEEVDSEEDVDVMSGFPVFEGDYVLAYILNNNARNSTKK